MRGVTCLSINFLASTHLLLYTFNYIKLLQAQSLTVFEVTILGNVYSFQKFCKKLAKFILSETSRIPCHHQITDCKLHVIIEYPLPYERLVWDYRKANIESIQKSVKSVNWENLFNNKTINKQVSIFNETIMNIFSNFVPNKLVTFGDSNPPWMNEFIKNKIKWKHQIYKTYIKNGCKDNDYISFTKKQS